MKEGAFGRTYFRDIYSAYNGKQYRKTSFDELKILIRRVIAQIITMLVLIKMVLHVKHH